MIAGIINRKVFAQVVYLDGAIKLNSCIPLSKNKGVYVNSYYNIREKTIKFSAYDCTIIDTNAASMYNVHVNSGALLKDNTEIEKYSPEVMMSLHRSFYERVMKKCYPECEKVDIEYNLEDVAEDSIVRINLMNEENYTPYCGNVNCGDSPRTIFNKIGRAHV